VDAEAAGIPAISIAPEQTGFLQFLLKAVNARHVIEVGSLAGYSAIAMARALPVGGRLIACEIEPMHAAFIRRKIVECGMEETIAVLEGPAMETLGEYLKHVAPGSIDAVFIDADKPGYRGYFDLLFPYVRTGGVVIGDNALAFGYIDQAESEYEPDNVEALRAFNDFISTHPGLQSTLVPLGDGMVIGLKL
jgi:predicted O-methyltransferase YrrM